MSDTRSKVTVVLSEHEGKSVWMLRAESGNYFARGASHMGVSVMYETPKPENAARFDEESKAHIFAWEKGYRPVSESEN